MHARGVDVAAGKGYRMRELRLLLVDDQSLFLEGLRYLLEAHGYKVVGAASDGLEALAKARALHPDVILMDVQMPRCDGLEATRLILAEMPEIKIVMLTAFDDDELLFEAIRAGAYGYLLKLADASESLELLARLSRDEPPLSRGIAAKLLREFARQGQWGSGPMRPPDKSIAELTPRQKGVLTLVARGLTYREIGVELCMTEHTVKYHMKQILERLHLENRAELIAYAHQAGLRTNKRSDGDSAAST